jgi:hypothetical protein
VDFEYTPSATSFSVYREKRLIKASNDDLQVLLPEGVPKNLNPDLILNFMSDDDKFFFDNRVPYFHMIIHWLRYAIAHIKLSRKKMTFIFALSPESPNQVMQRMSTITEHLVAKFKRMGHSVVFLDDSYAYVDNLVLYQETHHFDVGSTSEIAAFLSEDLEPFEAPGEKIYLSRGKTTTFNGNAFMSEISNIDPKDHEAIVSYRNENVYKFSDRVDDEKLLEDYFKTLDFRVVYPEDFPTYLDQLQTISSARILVSITSAGLVSSLVMQPGTVVVELSTPLQEDSGTYRVHVHYRELSDVNRKTYISIPHGRVAKEIVDGIEKNLPLKEFLSS